MYSAMAFYDKQRCMVVVDRDGEGYESCSDPSRSRLCSHGGRILIDAVCEGQRAGGLKQFQDGVLYESAAGR
jgi:hypothetical protein